MLVAQHNMPFKDTYAASPSLWCEVAFNVTPDANSYTVKQQGPQLFLVQPNKLHVHLMPWLHARRYAHQESILIKSIVTQ